MSEAVKYMARTRDYYAAQGYERPYGWASYDSIPFRRPVKPLAESRIALVTTAMPVKEEQWPKQVESVDASPPPVRMFAEDLAWDKQATHLDDLDSYLPINRLAELADRGRIGSVAPRFHCVPTEYSQRRTIEVDAPEILRRCREDEVDAAILVPL